MRMWLHRVVVIGTLLSSMMVGLHLPVLHEILEHGAVPRWPVMIALLVFAVLTVAGGWMLLRQGSGSGAASR
jgi:hypothetical protein